MHNRFRKLLALIFPLFFILFIVACDGVDDDDDDDITGPEYQLIDSLVTDKDTIWSGPQDPATITCYAQGDNITYLWFSELGDIQVLNTDGSQIKFTAADCCEGVREIFCTATDEGGSDTDTIPLYVLVDYSK